jgi:O-antigen/teichoic acid export membrane protein
LAIHDVSRHAARGTLWTYLGFASSRVLAFASSVLLARLLLPEQFGLMSYCLMAIQFIEILNTFGMDAALIARRDRFETAANTTFFFAMLISLATYAVTWMLAPWIARFFHAPEVTSLLRVLALVLPIGSLDLVHHSMVQRQLRFRQTVLPEIGAMLVKAVVAVLLAWRGFGAWSLVIGHVAGETVTTLCYWGIAPWWPRLRFDPQVSREIAHYGTHMIGIGLAGALLVNLDYILVGRLLGTTALGFYTLGYRVPELVIRNFSHVVGRVALPILSRVQEDRTVLHATYLTYVRFVSLFAFPAAAGIALTSHLMVPVFFTEKWLPTVPVMQMLAVAMGVAPLGFLPGVLYKAVNRPQILTRLVALKVPVSALLLWWGAQSGIHGVAVAQLGCILFAVFVDAWTVRRVLGIGAVAMLRAVVPATVSTLGMATTVALLLWAATPQGVAGLVLVGFVGVAAYVGCLRWFSRETLLRAWGMMRQLLRRPDAVEGS